MNIPDVHFFGVQSTCPDIRIGSDMIDTAGISEVLLPSVKEEIVFDEPDCSGTDMPCDVPDISGGEVVDNGD